MNINSPLRKLSLVGTPQSSAGGTVLRHIHYSPAVGTVTHSRRVPESGWATSPHWDRYSILNPERAYASKVVCQSKNPLGTTPTFTGFTLVTPNILDVNFHVLLFRRRKLYLNRPDLTHIPPLPSSFRSIVERLRPSSILRMTHFVY